MLHIQNLNVSIGEKKILNGIDLSIPAGQTHIVMGPNGSGKSTLAKTLAGVIEAQITVDCMTFLDQPICDMSIEQRAQMGIFLAFQYPPEIPGMSILMFLKEALGHLRRVQQKPPLEAVEFLALVKHAASSIGVDQDFLYRGLNEGFSGGEKKKNELLQMLILKPKLIILDELDSGMDIDALHMMKTAIESIQAEKQQSIVIITHYLHLLKTIHYDGIHILMDGIVKASGGRDIADRLEQQGYGAFT